MIDNNEIKKMLYRQKPNAVFQKATKDGLYYLTALRDTEDDDLSMPSITIHFLVPFSDIGDAVFSSETPAQHLIRYII